MEINVTGKGLDIGESLASYVQEHVRGIAQKYFDHTFEVNVTLSKDHHVIMTDVAAHVNRGMVLRSRGDNVDPYAAFDLALHKIETQLKRYKNRLKDHHAKHAVQEEEKTLQYVLAYDYGVQAQAVEHENSSAPVIAEFMGELPTLSVSDAVMRMDLSDAPALVFRNIAHGGLNVVHRRADGNVGWVDPEGAKSIRKIS